MFAPTDEAFAKLPAGTLDALLKDKAKLTAILTYHVVAGKVMAADVVKLKEAKTVQGQTVKIDTTKGVKVDGANVVKTDIVCSNGVIHVIDSVILPEVAGRPRRSGGNLARCGPSIGPAAPAPFHVAPRRSVAS